MGTAAKHLETGGGRSRRARWLAAVLGVMVAVVAPGALAGKSAGSSVQVPLDGIDPDFYFSGSPTGVGHLPGVEWAQLTSTASGAAVAWSPDGAWVALAEDYPAGGRKTERWLTVRRVGTTSAPQKLVAAGIADTGYWSPPIGGLGPQYLFYYMVNGGNPGVVLARQISWTDANGWSVGPELRLTPSGLDLGDFQFSWYAVDQTGTHLAVAGYSDPRRLAGGTARDYMALFLFDLRMESDALVLANPRELSVGDCDLSNSVVPMFSRAYPGELLYLRRSTGLEPNVIGRLEAMGYDDAGCTHQRTVAELPVGVNTRIMGDVDDAGNLLFYRYETRPSASDGLYFAPANALWNVQRVGYGATPSMLRPRWRPIPPQP